MPQELESRNPDGKLHSKIVEILASTSNGCLTELGYHPGMTEKLYQYIQHIQNLEGENARLYQDNCQLSSSVQLLNERVTHLSANQSSQLQQFAAMQEKIRTLETERNNLVRNNQDILISTNAGTSFQLLGVELARSRSQSTRLLRDMSILQTKYARLVNAQHGLTSPAGVSSPSDPVPRIALPIIPTPTDVHQRRSSADGAPRPQLPCLPLQQVPQSHLQLQRVQHAPLQPHQLQHSQQVQAQRWPSENLYPPQRSLPQVVGWTIPPPASAPPMFGARSSTTDSAPPPISAPSLPISAPHNPTRRHQLIPHIKLRTAYPTVSASVLPLNKQHTIPPPLPPSTRIDLTWIEPNERTTEQPAKDEKNEQPSNQKRPSSAVDGALAQDNEVTKRQRTAEPQDDNVDEKPVLPEPKSASEVTPPCQVGLSNDEVAIPAKPLDTVVGSSPSSPVSAEPPPSAPLTEEKTTGPQSENNMRSVEDCVYMIFERDAEIPNAYFCGRCLDRFESHMLSEPPDVVTSPKLENLLLHCVNEHPVIWDDLRYKRDLEVLPS